MTTAFQTHATLAAKNLHIENLPLLVTPHPLNDLTPEEVRTLAKSAYPVIIEQLTSSAPLAQSTRIDFVHPRHGAAQKA